MITWEETDVLASGLDFDGCDLLLWLRRGYVGPRAATALAARKFANASPADALIAILSVEPLSRFENKEYVDSLALENGCDSMDVFARDKACYLGLLKLLERVECGMSIDEAADEVTALYFDLDCPTYLDGRLSHSPAKNEEEAGPAALLSGWNAALAEVKIRIAGM